MRNINIEFLRVLMMLLIVSMHVSGRLCDLESLRFTRSLFSSILLSFRSVTFIGVSTFAFISGYYGIKFNLSKVIKMELMAMFYGLVVLFMALLFSVPLNRITLCGLLMPFSSEYLWYFSAYIWLCLLSPFINEGIKYLSKSLYLIILIIASLSIYFGRFIAISPDCTVLNLLFIYMLGQFLNKYKKTKFELIVSRPSFCVSCISMLMLSVFALSFLGYGQFIKLTESNNNPLVLLSAVSLFFLMKQANCNNKYFIMLSRLAPYMFAVYIFSSDILRTNIIDFSYLFGCYYLIIPISIFVLLTISLIEYGRLLLFKKFFDASIEKFVNYINDKSL